MNISPEILSAEATSTGFRPDVLEKVAHLLSLLDTLQSHPFLKSKLILNGKTLIAGCRKALAAVLPFTDAERDFLDLLLDKGEIDPTILTADEALQDRIQRQPLLKWKAVNVRQHRGLS